MKKKLLLLVLSFALCLPTFAESMCVNLRNGETVSFNLEDVKDVDDKESIELSDDVINDIKDDFDSIPKDEKNNNNGITDDQFFDDFFSDD